MAKNFHIDIYLRHMGDGAVMRKPLLSVASVEELHKVVDSIKDIGVYCDFSAQTENKAWVQYVLSEEGAYAEIILGEAS